MEQHETPAAPRGGFCHLLERALWTLIFLAVPVLGVWTWVIAPEHHWWFPPYVTTYGEEIDWLFYVILVMVGVTFVLTEGILVWCFFRYSRPSASKAAYTHGNHRLELVWTAIPAVLLLAVAFSQMGAWRTVKMHIPDGSQPDEPYTAARPLLEVWGSQFDWHARYPDAQGDFEGADAIETAYHVYVPADTKVVLRLRSRDVLHSFFVPEFRLKQDAVPGMAIPVWFEASEPGDYELICAELCGWGHYKMAGKVHVLPKDEFERWLERERRALYATD
jgi:cytochrome c oxidase subunit 2